MASKASLTVTPFMFLAVTSIPRGNRRSIFLIGGVLNGFLRIDGSSIELGDVLIFLWGREDRLAHIRQTHHPAKQMDYTVPWAIFDD